MEPGGDCRTDDGGDDVEVGALEHDGDAVGEDIAQHSAAHTGHEPQQNG